MSNLPVPTSAELVKWDQDKARRRGMMIVGFPRKCSCGGNAYHSPTAAWQNRVKCLDCGKAWSE